MTLNPEEIARLDPIAALEADIGQENGRVKVGTPESASLVIAHALLVLVKEIRGMRFELADIHAALRNR